MSRGVSPTRNTRPVAVGHYLVGWLFLLLRPSVATDTSRGRRCWLAAAPAAARNGSGRAEVGIDHGWLGSGLRPQSISRVRARASRRVVASGPRGALGPGRRGGPRDSRDPRRRAAWTRRRSLGANAMCASRSGPAGTASWLDSRPWALSSPVRAPGTGRCCSGPSVAAAYSSSRPQPASSSRSAAWSNRGERAPRAPPRDQVTDHLDDGRAELGRAGPRLDRDAPGISGMIRAPGPGVTGPPAPSAPVMAGPHQGPAAPRPARPVRPGAAPPHRGGSGR